MVEKDKETITKIAFDISNFQEQLENIKNKEMIKLDNIKYSQASYTFTHEKYADTVEDLSEVYKKLNECYHILIMLGV